MRTLPRHLLLAAVVLTVCCAERQAVAATVDLQRIAAEMAGERVDQGRSIQQHQRQRRAHHRFIRPAARLWQARIRAAFAASTLPAMLPPSSPVVHAVYPPSRFRLPPPALLA